LIKYPTSPNPKRQHGLAALVLLSILVLALSTATVLSLSLNDSSNKQLKKDIKALAKAKTTLLAYSTTQSTLGSLPCPDTDNPRDGLENRNGNICTANIGGLPYRNLAIDELRDSSGSHLWYAVSPSYTNNSGAIQRNSSINNNYFLNATEVTAVVIAPGSALDGQQRANVNVINYLEGENANGSIDTYAQQLSDDNNDLLIGLDLSEFWTLNQLAIAEQLEDLLASYRSACGDYPWAANFSVGTDNSVTNLQAGTFPLNSALPTDWNTGCAAGIQPSLEMQNNWLDEIYYAFCRVAEGNCLQVLGDTNQMTSAVVITPGIELATQNRNNYLLSEYFEDENANGNSPFRFTRSNNMSTTQNDHLHIITP